MTSPTPLLDRWAAVPKWKDMSSLYKDIRSDLDRVEDRLESWSRSSNPLTAEISGYVLRKRGKRLRPALVLLTSRLFSPGSEESVFLASLVELLHTASLIHDDIVDNAGVRRGKESVHSQVGAEHHRAARRLSLHQVDRPVAPVPPRAGHPPAGRRLGPDDRGRARRVRPRPATSASRRRSTWASSRTRRRSCSGPAAASGPSSAWPRPRKRRPSPPSA